MRLLIDTNILLRLGDKGHVMHGEAFAALDRLGANGHECLIVPQVIYEYWVVATRPAQLNGLGMTVASADLAVAHWMTVFPLMLDERGVFGRWRGLVVAHDVKGKVAHDARLVAAMQRHGLTNLLTFNKPDFARFASIQVFTPAEVLAGRVPA
jgi:predicted nucleic acid-binding protein